MRKEIQRRIKKKNGFCLNKKEKNEDTKCPCKDYRERGECDCGLYIRDYRAMVDELFGKGECA